MKSLKEKSKETGAIQVAEALTKKQLKQFIEFQYELYKGDKNFVPPLRLDMRNIITGKGNPLFKKGEYKLYLAVRDGQAIGRLAAGIDYEINRDKGIKDGYISLFECINDYHAAEALFAAAENWFRSKGMTLIKGPVSPTGGDDFRGLLVMGFDSSPVLMNSYNFEYYPAFFERYGFAKRLDLYAYHYIVKDVAAVRRGKAVEYAMKRYGYRVDAVNFNDMENELKDIKEVLDIALPESWEDMTPPSLDAIREFATTYKRLADPSLIRIARTDEGKPIGFSVALPNFNEIFIKMNGRLFPFGMLKLLTGRKRIKSARIFILFVVPEFRKKGVSGAIFYKSFQESMSKGLTWGEGSTIGETNYSMRRDAEGAGGVHYKTYRVYWKQLDTANRCARADKS